MVLHLIPAVMPLSSPVASLALSPRKLTRSLTTPRSSLMSHLSLSPPSVSPPMVLSPRLRMPAWLRGPAHSLLTEPLLVIPQVPLSTKSLRLSASPLPPSWRSRLGRGFTLQWPLLLSPPVDRFVAPALIILPLRAGPGVSTMIPPPLPRFSPVWGFSLLMM
jgi:hypothetical protein